MDAETLAQSAVNYTQKPTDLKETERSLWLAKAGHWNEAHDLCQTLPDPAGSWIHAWLHREEGDYGNACYWYARAGKPAASSSMWMTVKRWEQIRHAPSQWIEDAARQRSFQCDKALKSDPTGVRTFLFCPNNEATHRTPLR